MRKRLVNVSKEFKETDAPAVVTQAQDDWFYRDAYSKRAERLTDALTHARKGGILDVATIDDLLDFIKPTPKANPKP